MNVRAGAARAGAAAGGTAAVTTGRAALCRRIEPWLVGLIVAHTVAVGTGLLFLTRWATRFGGWEGVAPLFFPRQGGVFHFVVALGYLLEYRRGGVTLLVATKAIACVFLFGASLAEPVPWSVPVSGVLDGLMGAAVLTVRRLGGGAPGAGSPPAAGRTPR